MNRTAAEIEEEIAELFCTYLDLPSDFDRAASFVRLGGKSSTGMQLQLELKKRYGLVVTYAEMRKFSSARKIAQLIAERLEEQG